MSVDEAWGIDYRQTLFNGQAAARLDEAGVAVGQSDGQARGDQTALKGLQNAVFVRT